MSEIKDLVESYYNDVYVEEEQQLDEIAVNFGGQAAVDKVRSDMAAQRQSDAKLAAARQQRFGGGRTGGAKTRSELVGGAKPTPSAQQSGMYGRYAPPSMQQKTPSAPAARPLPAGAPKLGLKVTSPGAAKVAPSSAPAAKPAGSAMDQWAAANPKLAAAKAERDRTRGTSATTNPLMKDMKANLPAPTSPSPTTAKTGFDLAKKGIDLSKK